MQGIKKIRSWLVGSNKKNSKITKEEISNPVPINNVNKIDRSLSYGAGDRMGNKSRSTQNTRSSSVGDRHNQRRVDYDRGYSKNNREYQDNHSEYREKGQDDTRVAGGLHGNDRDPYNCNRLGTLEDYKKIERHRVKASSIIAQILELIQHTIVTWVETHTITIGLFTYKERYSVDENGEVKLMSDKYQKYLRGNLVTCLAMYPSEDESETICINLVISQRVNIDLLQSLGIYEVIKKEPIFPNKETIHQNEISNKLDGIQVSILRALFNRVRSDVEQRVGFEHITGITEVIGELEQITKLQIKRESQPRNNKPQYEHDTETIGITVNLGTSKISRINILVDKLQQLQKKLSTLLSHSDVSSLQYLKEIHSLCADIIIYYRNL